MGEAYNPEEILKEKQAKRAALRTQFWKEVTNPHRHATGEGGHIVSVHSVSVLHHHGCLYKLIVNTISLNFSSIQLFNDTLQLMEVSMIIINQHSEHTNGL